MVACVANNLSSSLGISKGITCFIGAGGKKSCMYALAVELPGRVALTSTTRMYEYDEGKVDHIIWSLESSKFERERDKIESSRVVAFAKKTETRKRVGGLSSLEITHLSKDERFDYVLVKADGARSRLVKAPDGNEPLVPKGTGLVVPFVSVRIVGRTLSSGIAHRPEQVASVMGIGLDEPISPKNVACLLSSPQGALHGVGTARVVPILNMMDNDRLVAYGEEIASLALSMTKRFDKIILTQLLSSRICKVIERQNA